MVAIAHGRKSGYDKFGISNRVAEFNNL